MLQQLKVSSLATVLEGESYPVRVTVTNRSTRAGEPCETDLAVEIEGSTYYTTLIPTQRIAEHFDAGQAKAFTYSMNVPMGSGGETGSIRTRVFAPDGSLIAAAEEPITIQEVVAPPLEYTLSATATAGGYVSPASITVKEGETATITAYPYSGYVFDHWIREGLTSYSNPYMAIMYRDISIVAYFRGAAPPPVYTCPYCGAPFASEAELNYHISTAHPPAPPPPVCQEGETMWVGSTFYYCENGQWKTPPII